MILPISSSRTFPEFFIEDLNYNMMFPEDICHAINNAAAGPWEFGDVPDGKTKGEKLFFCYNYDSPNPEDISFAVVWWNVDRWTRFGSEKLPKPAAFARINPPKEAETTKGETK